MPKGFVDPWNNWFHVMCNTYGTWPAGDPRGFRTRHHREHIEGDYKHRPPEGTYDEWLERSRRLMARDAVVLDDESARRAACLALVEAMIHYGCVVAEACVTPVHAHALVRFPTMGEMEEGIKKNAGNPPIVGRKNPPTGVGGLLVGEVSVGGGLGGEDSDVEPGRVRIAMTGEQARKLQRMLKGNSLQDGRDPIPRVVVGKAKSWAATQVGKAGFIVRGEGGLWAVRSKEEPVGDDGHWENTVKYIRDHLEERGVVWSMVRGNK